MSNQQQQQPEPPPTLKECWEVVHAGSDDEYITQAQLVEWTNRVLSGLDRMDLLQRLDLQELIAAYIQEIHELDQNSVSNVMFKYEEAVEFYNWIINRQDNQPEQDPAGQSGEHGNPAEGQERQQQGGEEPQQQNEADDAREEQQEKEEQGQAPIENPPSQTQQKSHKAQPQETEDKKPKQQTGEDEYMYPADPTNSHNNADQQQQNQDGMNEFNQFEKETKVQETGDNEQISKHYRQYLNIVFDHYCRMSYATGNDPTFEQIQHKTQIMTINKFMIFCKEFGIVKLNSMTRAWLLEIFKKNSEYYKEMNFQQFIDVLLKISQIVYSPQSQEPTTEKSREFEQLLFFLEVNNQTVFKKKTAALGISYRLKGPITVSKVTPSNYQFKFKPTVVAESQPAEQRKAFRSEKKPPVQPKVQSSTNIRKRELSRKDINRKEVAERQKRNNSMRPQVQSHPQRSNNHLRKLPPPIPPAKKSMPARQPEQVVTGYANIHRMKMGKPIGTQDSRLKLNQVVEDARRMVESQSEPRIQTQKYGRVSINHDRRTPYTDMDQLSGQSTPLEPPSRDKSYSQYGLYSQRIPPGLSQVVIKMNKYEPYGHSALEKRPDMEMNQQLEGIVGSDSDDDEFLKQHLNRERKNDIVTQRIAKKIQQIDR